ncbi:MAG TPA: hypothetical protein VK190_11245 [Pseudoneobacillus sp.]|nr:hypothetical protein [Pseudoneobacillus sp.]
MLLRKWDYNHMKKILLSILFVGLLAGCGGFKADEELTLNEKIISADSIDTYINDMDDAPEEIFEVETGVWDTGYGDIKMIDQGHNLKVVKVDKEQHMVLVDDLEGPYTDNKWWVSEDDLKNATE